MERTLPIEQSSFSATHPSQTDARAFPPPQTASSTAPTLPSALRSQAASSTDVAFLHHYITQCEYVLQYYQSIHPSVPPPSLPPSLPCPLWLQSTSQLAHLPGLIAAYEERVNELTSQVELLLRDVRERDARVQAVEAEMEALVDRWRRPLERDQQDGKQKESADKGGLREELDDCREQVELLKQRETLRGQEWKAERARLEDVVVQQRAQVAAVTQRAASNAASSQPLSELVQQGDALQAKVTEAVRALDVLKVELSVEKDERVRAEADVRRVKADAEERSAELEHARRLLSTMEKRLGDAEQREQELGQQLVAADAEKERVCKAAELRAHEVDAWKRRCEAAERSTKRDVDEARTAARAGASSAQGRHSAEERQWREERQRLEADLVESTSRAERLHRDAMKGEERFARMQADFMRRVDECTREVNAGRVSALELQEERRADKERLDAELEQVRAVKATYIKDMEALRTANRKLTDKEERLQHDLLLLQQTASTAQQVETRRDKEAALAQRLHAQQLQRLQDRLDGLQRTHGQFTADTERQRAQLEAQVAALTATAADAAAKCATAEEEGRRLKDEADRKAEDVERGRRSCALLHERVKETEQRELAWKAQTDRLRTDVGRLTVEASAFSVVEAGLRAEAAAAVCDRDAVYAELEMSKVDAESWRDRAESERVKVILARRALEERAAALVSTCERATPPAQRLRSALERTVMAAPNATGLGALSSFRTPKTPSPFSSPGHIALPPTSLPLRSLAT